MNTAQKKLAENQQKKGFVARYPVVVMVGSLIGIAVIVFLIINL